MTPILFISDIPLNSLVDPSAIGVDANPFESRLDIWEKLGLADYVDGVNTGRWAGWQEVHGSGPDGFSGVAIRVLSHGSKEEAAPIFSRDTVWLRASDRVWFSACDWQPADLLRYSFQPLPTHTQKLSDGKLWDVPRIRRPISGGHILHPSHNLSELPQRVRRTWSGEPILEPSPKWLDLWDHSRKFADHLWGDDVQVGYVELLDYALRVLQLRYRFGELMSRAFPECLEVGSLWTVARASVGWDLVVAEIEQKKRLAEATALSA